MAGALIGGAALGPAFDKLFLVVADASRRVYGFKSDFKKLESLLSELEPIFHDIQKLDELIQTRSYETNMLMNQLAGFESLIEDCSKVKRHQFCKKWKYSRKLEKLEKLLLRFFQIHVPIQNFRDSKKILATVNGLDEKVDVAVDILKHFKSLSISSGHGIGDLGGASVGAVAIGTPNLFPGLCDVPAVRDIVGFDVRVQELKKMLLKEDEHVLVISAPGGSGKTTLALMLCHDEGIKAAYNHISFVTVSSIPNLRDNQLQHHLLQASLVSGSVLLVLDDVWPESHSVLEELISHIIPKCKVLITTRCEFPRFKYTYKLQLLPDSDAMTLFCNSAFKDGKCNVRRDLVDKVVKSCGGFPLALKVVGGSLYGQHEIQWINRVEGQSKDQILFCSSSSDLLNRLQPSISALDKTLKDCYLDLGVFFEDQRIPLTVLLDMWVELYDLGEEVRASGFLLDLASRNLIDLAFRRKNYPASIGFSNAVHYVSQHDVLRELAIHLSAKENRMRLSIGKDIDSEQKSQLLQAHILSITADETLFSNGYEVQVPNLEVLLLNFKTSSYTIPEFVVKSNHLKVLVATNSDISPTKISNFALLGHLQNLKRIRLERISLSSIRESTFTLANLKKISLVVCEIGDAFHDCDVRMPNLEEINIEYCHDLEELPVGICNLVHLKTLSINHCQELVSIPEELGNLESLEVLMLHSCSSLECLPDSIRRLCKLRFLDIFECMELDPIPEQIGELRALKTIFMGGRQGVDDLPKTLLELEELESVICDEETASLWEHCEHLRISIVKDDMNLNWLHKSSCIGRL